MTTIDASSTLVENILGNVDRLVRDVVRDSSRLAKDAEALWSSAGTAGDLLRASPRFIRIARTCLTLVARYRALASLRPWIGKRRYERRVEALHEDAARSVYDMCAELRGGVLKIGQLLSARPDILPAAYIEALSKLQDSAPAVDSDAIIESIEASLGQPVDDLYADFDREPIAAASLAQVHAARLADGTEVVVKVLVPNIESDVEADLAALRVVSNAVSDALPVLDMATVTEELSRAIRAELDYEREADNAEDMARIHAGDSDIVVPAVFRSLCSDRVITLERIDGSRLTDALAVADRATAGRILELLVGTLIDQILHHGVFQADPHPGNFLVVPGDPVRLALLDFGCVERLSQDARRGYRDIVMAAVTFDAARLSARLTDLGFSAEGIDISELAELLLAGFREGGLAEMARDPRGEMEKALRRAQRATSVKVPHHFVMIGRVLAAVGGLVLSHADDIDPAALMLRAISRAPAS